MSSGAKLLKAIEKLKGKISKEELNELKEDATNIKNSVENYIESMPIIYKDKEISILRLKNYSNLVKLIARVQAKNKEALDVLDKLNNLKKKLDSLNIAPIEKKDCYEFIQKLLVEFQQHIKNMTTYYKKLAA